VTTTRILILTTVLVAGLSSAARGQQADTVPPDPPPRLHISVDLMAGYGVDLAQWPMGFESQGRIGFAIVGLAGRLTPRVAYRIQIDPVNDGAPLPACGDPGFFYPNEPQASFGPRVECDREGLRRVDDYKFVSLDPVGQQGPIRQAYVDLGGEGLRVRFGRFVLPIGFAWDEAGSLTAKDATHIQRIDAEANFGLQATWVGMGPREDDVKGPPRFVLHAAAVLGDGNRGRDYDYFYFADASLDSNSALTSLVSLQARPTRRVELRAAGRFGFTGSKVERLPNYFASKRNDHALVLSARFAAAPRLSVFGEWARYTWGPTPTSAALLGVDPAPIHKAGFYVGAEGSRPVGTKASAGLVFTHEALSRDDSLVRLMAARAAYGTHMGEVERSTAVRAFVDLVGGALRIGGYYNRLDNPLPWLSGIVPVSGPGAFVGRGSDKWGIAVRLRVS